MQDKASLRAKIIATVTWVTVVVCALTGVAATAGAVYIAAEYHDADPILLKKDEAAIQQLTDMMDCICTGDFSAASQYMLGNPSLGAEKAPEDALALLLWNTWKDSISYELKGECYTTQSGLTQDITIHYLDISSITEHLREDAEKLMEQRVAEAEDVSEIYDENNEYRQDFVTEVLCEAAEEAVKKYSRSTSISIAVNMLYQNGQWWVLAEEPLLHAISGGILY